MDRERMNDSYGKASVVPRCRLRAWVIVSADRVKLTGIRNLSLLYPLIAYP